MRIILYSAYTKKGNNHVDNSGVRGFPICFPTVWSFFKPLPFFFLTLFKFFHILLKG